MNHFISILLLLFCFTQNSSAQVRPQKNIPPKQQQTEKQDTSKKVIVVEYSDYAEGFIEEEEEIRKLAGNVELRQDSVFMSCDTATIKVQANTLEAEGEVIIQQNDTLVIFSDSLAYLGNERIADLFYNVVLQNGDQQLFTDRLNYNLETKLAQYFAGGILTDGKTQLQSKRGYYYADTNNAFFKDSVLVVDPEFELQADTLQFNTQSKVVTFLGPTRINIGESKIYCEGGFYDTEKNKARFETNPQFVKGEQQATASLITYDGQKKEIILDGDAIFVDNDRRATADRIRYDETNDITYLEGNAYFEDGEQRIRSEVIVYDGKNGKYTTSGRSVVNDGEQILKAENIDFDDATGLGIATGNVFWKDTVNNLTITSEEMRYDQNSDYLIASGGTPTMTSLIEGDTLFLVADTLLAIRADQMKKEESDTLQTTKVDSTLINKIVEDSISMDTTFVKNNAIKAPKDSMIVSNDTIMAQNDTISVLDTINLTINDTLEIKKIKAEEPDTSRNLIAYGDVRMYKNDLQAVCDSLVFEGRDSIFNFYKDPLVWSDTTQFSADTIQMKMQGGKLDTIFLKEKAFVVNSPDEILFNQIKGRDIQAYFQDNELYKLLVEGNAEFVYYLLDEQQSYIGVNKSVCSNMILNFENNNVQRINCFPNPKAQLLPVKSAAQIELDGYGWYLTRRPNSKADLYKERGKQPMTLDSLAVDSLQIDSKLMDSLQTTIIKEKTEKKDSKEKSDSPPASSKVKGIKD